MFTHKQRNIGTNPNQHMCHCTIYYTIYSYYACISKKLFGRFVIQITVHIRKQGSTIRWNLQYADFVLSVDVDVEWVRACVSVWTFPSHFHSFIHSFPVLSSSNGLIGFILCIVIVLKCHRFWVDRNQKWMGKNHHYYCRVQCFEWKTNCILFSLPAELI